MKKRNILIICVANMLATGLAIGVFSAFNIIYENGVATGREQMARELSDNIGNLGKAVSEKNNFMQKSYSILSDAPAEINTESIDTYIEKMTELKNSVSLKTVREELDKYISEWQDFKTIYASEDNSLIQEKFNQLKAGALEIGAKIKTLYDENIKSAVESL
ncbi:hypothetical protein IJ117_00220 [Candidatus Saccharibacteria bacterium]|nr:hypothetical protein [Candidatus Saccharibacteria bacterium]